MVYLPLICLGLRKYDREGKPWLFVLSFGMMVMSNFYFAYMNCIYLAIFALFISIRYESLRSSLTDIARRFVLVLLGFGLGAAGFIPSIYAFFSADREKILVSSRFLLDGDQVIPMIKRFFTDPFLFGGIAIFVLGLAILAFRKRAVNRKVALALFSFSMIFFPWVHSLMNGLSYESFRWYYLIAFSIAYAVPSLLETIWEKKQISSELEKYFRLIRELLFTVVILYFAVFFWKVYGSSVQWAIDKITIIWIVWWMTWLGIIGIALIKRTKLQWRMVSLILLLSVNGIMNNYIYIYRTSSFLLTEDDYIYQSTAFYNPDVFEDDSFYRVSNWLIEVGSKDNRARTENTEMILGNHGLTSYNSLIKKDLMHWFKYDHNVNTIYTSPSHYRGLNNRLFLENIWGVKYKINTESQPYGYLQRENNGTIFYENEYPLGIDFWYDSYLAKDDYDAFGHAQRDASLMQAAVIERPVNLREAELDETIQNLGLDFSQITAHGCHFENGHIEVPYEAGEHIWDANTGELIIPLGERPSAGEFLVSFDLKTLEGYPKDEIYNFRLVVNDQITYRYSDTYNWTYLLDQYTYKLDGTTDEIRIELSPGKYVMSDLECCFSSYEKLGEWTDQLNKYNLIIWWYKMAISAVRLKMLRMESWD